MRLFRGFGLHAILVRREFSDDISDAFPGMRREGVRVTMAGREGVRLLPELERAKGSRDHQETI